ncbi:hypothetical protein AusDCA_2887 [Desulfitobacterium sp. AusDCA]
MFIFIAKYHLILISIGILCMGLFLSEVVLRLNDKKPLNLKNGFISINEQFP